jgi:hypothetical protein
MIGAPRRPGDARRDAQVERSGLRRGCVVSYRFGPCVIVAAVLGASALACGRDSRVGFNCGDFVAPGVIVARPGVEVSLHNDQRQAIAQGTTAILLNRSDSIPQTFVEDSATLALYVPAGTFTIRLSKPSYRDTTLSNVVVQPGDCGTIQTTKLAVTLHAAPTLSTVRSVSIFGAAFLDAPGAAAQLSAIVDAVPGGGRSVRWSIDDGSLASVDRDGRVVAKCSTSGGVATVTARAVADSTVGSSVRLAIAPANRC